MLVGVGLVAGVAPVSPRTGVPATGPGAPPVSEARSCWKIVARVSLGAFGMKVELPWTSRISEVNWPAATVVVDLGLVREAGDDHRRVVVLRGEGVPGEVGQPAERAQGAGRDGLRHRRRVRGDRVEQSQSPPAPRDRRHVGAVECRQRLAHHHGAPIEAHEVEVDHVPLAHPQAVDVGQQEVGEVVGRGGRGAGVGLVALGGPTEGQGVVIVVGLHRVGDLADPRRVLPGRLVAGGHCADDVDAERLRGHRGVRGVADRDERAGRADRQAARHGDRDRVGLGRGELVAAQERREEFRAARGAPPSVAERETSSSTGPLTSDPVTSYLTSTDLESFVVIESIVKPGRPEASITRRASRRSNP